MTHKGSSALGATVEQRVMERLLHEGQRALARLSDPTVLREAPAFHSRRLDDVSPGLWLAWLARVAAPTGAPTGASLPDRGP
jgi:hypothetical protein